MLLSRLIKDDFNELASVILSLAAQRLNIGSSRLFRAAYMLSTNGDVHGAALCYEMDGGQCGFRRDVVAVMM